MKIDSEDYDDIRDEWLKSSVHVRRAIPAPRFVEIHIKLNELMKELRQPNEEAEKRVEDEFDAACKAAGIESVDEFAEAIKEAEEDVEEVVETKA